MRITFPNTPSNRPTSTRQTRFGPVAASIAVVAVAATAFVGGQSWVAGAADVSDATTFVPVPTCRLFDTRDGEPPEDGRKTPLGPGEAMTQPVTGNVGNCDIPDDATAVAMNVTTVGPTADSFLSIFPDDIANPGVSNLNYTAGQAPTPNWVDVKLSPSGAVRIVNFAGEVDVLADVGGYYTTAPLDAIQDRLQELSTDLAGVVDVEDRLTDVEGSLEALAASNGQAAAELEALAASNAQAAAELDAARSRIDELEQLPAPFVTSDQTGIANELGTGEETYASVSVTAPSAGSVVLNSHALVRADTGGDTFICGIVDEDAPLIGNFQTISAQIDSQASENGGYTTISGTRRYAIDEGETLVFELRCRTQSGPGDIAARNLVAVFIPDPDL